MSQARTAARLLIVRNKFHNVILSDSEESLIVLETLRYAQGDMVVITTT